MRRWLGLLVVALAAGGCSGDGPTGSNTTSVAGTWTYSVTNLSGGGLSCNISGVLLTLTQNGSNFQGTYTGGTLSCAGLGSSGFTGGSVVSGTVAGNAVTFNFDDADYHHTGTATSGSMTGSAILKLDATTTLAGTFSATKQ
jgi:hypothetical protein